MMLSRVFMCASFGGMLALDFTGIGPFMVTQPLVCGPLLAHFLGHPVVGLVIGGVVQLLWLDITPIGVGIPFDPTAVTLLATYWASLPQSPDLSQMALALFIAVPFGFLFKATDFMARRFNSSVARAIDSVSDESFSAFLAAGIAGGLLWSFVRYFVVYAISMLGGEQIWYRVLESPRPLFVDQGLTVTMVLLPVAGLGAALELFLSDQPEQRFHGWRAVRLRSRRRRGDSDL